MARKCSQLLDSHPNIKNKSSRGKRASGLGTSPEQVAGKPGRDRCCHSRGQVPYVAVLSTFFQLAAIVSFSKQLKSECDTQFVDGGSSWSLRELCLGQLKCTTVKRSLSLETASLMLFSMALFLRKWSCHSR